LGGRRTNGLFSLWIEERSSKQKLRFDEERGKRFSFASKEKQKTFF